MKVSFDWLKDYVTVKDSAESVAQLLTMAGLEVEHISSFDGDHVLTTEVTTNRPDWLSHIGVAREIHAVSGRKFRFPQLSKRTASHGSRDYQVVISKEDSVLCPYYSAVLLEDVEWGETPKHMKKRLEACGIRSINFPADVTNYVLLEMGQPLHAFSADRISGEVIYARRAHAGEAMVAIDGKKYELLKDDLVIADEKGPVALAGVMGGKESEVTHGTRKILLESAFFQPASIRKTSRRLKLSSESSYRFERGVDPKLVDVARERAIDLFLQYARVGRVGPVCRAGRLPVFQVSIRLDLSAVQKVLGVEIPAAKIVSLLTRLGMEKKKKTKTAVTFNVPSFRPDLTRPADLIEEIARLHGYHRIPESLPEIKPAAFRPDPVLNICARAREICTAAGLNETVTFSLIDPSLLQRLDIPDSGWVRVFNSQNRELTLMRPTLLASLAQVLKRNLNVGESSVRIFEVADRYVRDKAGDLPKEEKVAAIAICGDAAFNWMEPKRRLGFYDLKGIVETFLREMGCRSCQELPCPLPGFDYATSVVDASGQMLGYYGQISGRSAKAFDLDDVFFYAEFELSRLLDFSRTPVVITELPKFPSSPRDLTLIVADDARSEALVRQISALGKGWIKRVDVFDCFRGGRIPDGKKSLSFRLIYQSHDRTLQNQEVNELHFSIVDALSREFNAELPKK